MPHRDVQVDMPLNVPKDDAIEHIRSDLSAVFKVISIRHEKDTAAGQHYVAVIEDIVSASEQ